MPRGSEKELLKNEDMDISDDLIQQWEPKIQALLRGTFVLGYDKADLEQELRIAIVKAASSYDETKQVSFHTYLHTVMTNHLRSLISRAKRHRTVYETYNIDGISLNNNTDGYISPSLSESLTDETSMDFIEDIELQDILNRSDLNDIEKLFLELRLEGTPMERISLLLDEPAYKIRNNIQKKVLGFLYKIRRHLEDPDEKTQ